MHPSPRNIHEGDQNEVAGEAGADRQKACAAVKPLKSNEDSFVPLRFPNFKRNIVNKQTNKLFTYFLCWAKGSSRSLPPLCDSVFFFLLRLLFSSERWQCL